MDGTEKQEKQARVWLGRCRSEPSPGATTGVVTREAGSPAGRTV